MLYVVESLSLTTFIPLMEVDTFDQANIMINKTKSFPNYKGEVYSVVSTPNRYKEVTAHFNDYSWD